MSNPEGPAPEEQAIEPDLPIIDTHHHLWNDPPFPMFAPFPIEELAEERARCGHHIPATVFVDCQTGYLTEGPEPMRVVGETRAIARMVDDAMAQGVPARGLAAKIVSRADMRLGAAVEEVLRAHIEASPTRFRGIRHMAPWHPERSFFGLDISEGMMRLPAFCEGVARLAALDLSFDAWVLYTQLADVAYLARRVPEATIVLDHAGTPMDLPPPHSAAERFELWKAGMAEVAACPNVVVKLGGVMMHHAAPQAVSSADGVATMREHILPTIDLFGPDRCMFESNFPIDRPQISYGNLWNAYKRLTADFTRTEREAMFAGTAARVYRIDLGAI
jgi:L-fuconolactonase